MNILKNKTITDIPGILASGISAGIKKDGKKDLCVIYSKYKAVAAAVFTLNKTKAAPVLVDMDNIKNDNTQAIVVNSGNANSCTGEEGILNAYMMIEAVANNLNLSRNDILVASTGALGMPLPMDVIIPGIKKACTMLSPSGGMEAAQAIVTTDTFVKTITVEFNIEGQKVMLGGIAKGSTMIHPNMGTMLSFLVTDANISKNMLDKSLKASVDKSYNMISVDGDTSTNDICIILANGASKHTLIECENENYNVFCNALDFVNIELAKMVARDGEGSTKLLEVVVSNAKTIEGARKLARTVISSNLVKCAFWGGIADWPRIMCALGYSEEDFNPNKVDIFIKNEPSDLQIVKDGIGTGFSKETAAGMLNNDIVKILIDLKIGEKSAAAYGCDLGIEYVKANAYLFKG